MTGKIPLKVDTSPAARARREAEVDRRLAASTATGAARATERRALAAAVEAEEAADREAAAATSEATAERSRVAAVVRAGRDRGRPQQALRLALAGPLDAGQAAAILATLPLDRDADEVALALPGFVPFGGEAAQAERRRIMSIFSHPSAAERFTAAVALALGGETALPSEAVLALLAGLPPETARPRQTEMDRRMAAHEAEGHQWFGCDASPAPGGRGQRSADLWASAVRRANAEIGVQSKGAAYDRPAPGFGPARPGTQA